VSGLWLEEIESGGKALILFALGLVFVYLTLAAQYESFVLPFIVLLAGSRGRCWARSVRWNCRGLEIMCIAISAW